jgi:hypothetical protein
MAVNYSPVSPKIIMDQIEPLTHSFIVKIWLEGMDEQSGQALWRGRITHVPSGLERYFDNLTSLIDFIVPYLEEIGAASNKPERLYTRFNRWLNNWFRQVVEP